MKEKVEERIVTEMAATGEPDADYQAVFGDVSRILDAARESAARSVNAAMTAGYWLIGRRIVEFEQSGEERAEYGAALLERLAEDLTGRFGRAFPAEHLQHAAVLPLVSARPDSTDTVWRIGSTLPAADSPDTVWRKRPRLKELDFDDFSLPFRCPGPLRAASVGEKPERPPILRDRGAPGWLVGPPTGPADQLQFYERTALSQNRAAMLTRGQEERPEDLVLPEQQFKDPSSSNSST